MKKEQILELMSALPPDLVEEADIQAPAKRRFSKGVRGALIAACLCLALVGTAGAIAGAAGVNIRLVDYENGQGYVVTDEGFVLFPVSNFPAEVLALGEEPNENGGDTGRKFFATWEEVRQFLGISLASNSVLDSAGRGYSYAGEGVTHILLNTHGAGQEMTSASVYGSFRMEDIIINVNMLIRTDHFKKGTPYVEEGFEEEYEEHCKVYGDMAFMRAVGEGDEVAEEEIYTARCGSLVTIVRYTDHVYGVKYHANFYLNGVLFNIEASPNRVGYTPETMPNDPAHTLEVLKQVLDGFEL